MFGGHGQEKRTYFRGNVPSDQLTDGLHCQARPTTATREHTSVRIALRSEPAPDEMGLMRTAKIDFCEATVNQDRSYTCFEKTNFFSIHMQVHFHFKILAVGRYSLQIMLALNISRDTALTGAEKPLASVPAQSATGNGLFTALLLKIRHDRNASFCFVRILCRP